MTLDEAAKLSLRVKEFQHNVGTTDKSRGQVYASLSREVYNLERFRSEGANRSVRQCLDTIQMLSTYLLEVETPPETNG